MGFAARLLRSRWFGGQTPGNSQKMGQPYAANGWGAGAVPLSGFYVLDCVSLCSGRPNRIPLFCFFLCIDLLVLHFIVIGGGRL